MNTDARHTDAPASDETPIDLTTEPVAQEGDIVVEASLSDEAIESILTALDDGRDEDVRMFLEELSPADCGDLLSKIGTEDRAFLIDRFPHVFTADVFSWLAPELARQTLEQMTPVRVAKLIASLDTDDAVQLIEDLSPRVQKQILLKLSEDEREALEEGLTYPEDSAGRLMSQDVVSIPRFWTVGKTIDYMRDAVNELPEHFTVIFVIDPMYHVVGEIPLNRILTARRSTKIEDLALDAIHPIRATTDQEDVARLFQREELTSAPVVDENNRIIGVITVDDVVGVISEEAQEDILRLGGVEGGSDLYKALVPTAVSRFWWLAINLGTAFLASSVVGLFEATIEQIVALAVLMPIVAGMGGNAGTQTLTVVVRALAMRELSKTNMSRMIFKETAVGFLNGAAFALITGGIAAWWFDSQLLGVVIGLAMIINLIAAGLFGILIPLALQKFKIDPALASAVFLTTVTDCIGFLSFLGLAAWLML